MLRQHKGHYRLLLKKEGLVKVWIEPYYVNVETKTKELTKGCNNGFKKY